MSGRATSIHWPHDFQLPILGFVPPTSEDTITNIRDLANQYKGFHRVFHTSQGTGSPIHREGTLTKFCTE